MANLTFIGAAGTVTGSKHLLTVGGKRILIDCGMFQGTVDVRTLNDAPLPIPADDIDAVVITHGHIDHVGFLPKLIHDGFAGPVYCTPPTAALMQIVLNDAARLQHYMHARGLSHERPHAPGPYYDQQDVDATMRHVHPVDYEQPFDIVGVAKVTLHNAGHILGSAFAAIEFEQKRVIFSGDLGRYDRPLLFDPSPIGTASVLVCESTYGDRAHPPQPLDDLRKALLDGMARGGAMVIPCFSVERTQDLLYAIGQLQRLDGQLAGLPIHLDSPMAEEVDDLFTKFPNDYRPLGDASAPTFGCHNLTIHVSAEDSKKLHDVKGPHVILSASGMAAGGRVLHHLHNHLGDQNATIIFVGYQGAGTLGNLLLHGAHTVHILGESILVRANIVDIQGYSAHADINELLRWFSTCTSTPRFFAVHGEPTSAAALCATVTHKLNWPATVAARGTTVDI